MEWVEGIGVWMLEMPSGGCSFVRRSLYGGGWCCSNQLGWCVRVVGLVVNAELRRWWGRSGICRCCDLCSSLVTLQACKPPQYLLLLSICTHTDSPSQRSRLVLAKFLFSSLALHPLSFCGQIDSLMRQPSAAPLRSQMQ